MSGEGAAPQAPNGLAPPWAQRGGDTGRLLALSDGIFAFAMTLLVLGLALPLGFRPVDLGGDLWDLRGEFLAFALSFLVIWLYWLAHHQIFSYVVRYDRPLLQLNVVFLLCIAVMPFITEVLAAAAKTTVAVVLYAAIQVAAGGTLSALWVYASGRGRHLTPDLPASWTEYVLVRTAITPVVFAVSIPVAFVSPGGASLLWIGIFVVQLVVRKQRLRGEAEPLPPAPPSPR